MSVALAGSKPGEGRSSSESVLADLSMMPALLCAVIFRVHESFGHLGMAVDVIRGFSEQPNRPRAVNNTRLT